MQLTAQNVLAVLPGKGDLVGQWLILGAHYDHLGFISWNADSVTIYNGADDNASGVALLLEIARYLTHYYTAGVAADDARRSIMFQAYDAEERGLLGSWHYVQNPTVPTDSIVAMVNLDMVGRMRDNRLVVAGSNTASQWTGMLEGANEDQLSVLFSEEGLSRSDQWPFLQLGKPVLFLSTGMHDDWHTPNDDVWLLDVPGMVKVGDLVVALLDALAIHPARPVIRRQWSTVRRSKSQRR
jgi:Zn-dependent M28 family amino/carboxypeptidase